MNYGSTDPEAAAAAALPKAAQPIGSPRRAEIQDMGGGVGSFRMDPHNYSLVIELARTRAWGRASTRLDDGLDLSSNTGRANSSSSSSSAS